MLVDILCGGGFRRNAYMRRIAQNGACELDDIGSKRGGEEQRLTPSRQQGNDAFHIAQKSHVEHAVHFIEHEELDL